MSSLRPIVDQQCGQSNALVQFSNRLMTDANSSRQMMPLLPSTSGTLADQFTNQYLSEMSGRAAAPSNFSMHSLIHQIDQVPQRSIEPAQGVTAREWSQQYLSKAQPTEWAQQYLQNHNTLVTSHDSVMQDAWHTAATGLPVGNESMKWSAEYLADFDSGAIAGASKGDGMQNWADEYMSYRDAMQSQHGQTDFWANLESEWDNMASQSAEHEWLNDYESSISSMYKDYSMQQDNPYMNVENALQKGKEMLARGDLANAILYFEAAVQNEPNSAEAWRYVGMGQAENEQEPSAIAALKKSLELDPTNLDARFLLAVAYTNESLYNDAILELEHWLNYNPAYSHLDLNQMKHRQTVSSFLDRNLFEEVERKFLQAASAQPGRIDSDLQNSIGVLYNLSGNFERAVDSLQAALQVKPDDPRLWNRLGATLANSDRSADAVSAYSKALELYPGFVRARYNLGISCLNLKSHRESIEHFVSAVSLQQRGLGPTSKQNMSDSIWQTMRMATMSIPDNAFSGSRTDLLHAMDRKDFVAIAQMFGTHPPSTLAPPLIQTQTV